jgi:hypothetical protein
MQFKQGPDSENSNSKVDLVPLLRRPVAVNVVRSADVDLVIVNELLFVVFFFSFFFFPFFPFHHLPLSLYTLGPISGWICYIW